MSDGAPWPRPVHVVRRQTFELALADSEGALAVQEEVRRVATTRLLGVVDEAFSASNCGQEVIRLERLELDLGVLSSSRLAEDLVARTQARIGAVLDRAVASMRAGFIGTSAKGRILPASASKLELMRAFLETGSLPWWCPRTTALELESILSELADESPRELAEMLRRIATRTHVVLRLVKQFTRTTHRKLLRLLAGTAAAELERIGAEWLLLLSAPSLRLPAALESEPVVALATLELALGRARDALGAESLYDLIVQRLEPSETDAFLEGLAAASAEFLARDSGVRLWLEGRASIPRKTLARKTLRRSRPSGGARGVEGRPGEARATEPRRLPGPADEVQPRAGPETARGPRARRLQEKDASGTRSGSTTPFREDPSDVSLEPDASERDSGAGAESWEPEIGEAYYVDHAGLVLVWPFLTRFFGSLDLLLDQRTFRSDAARERAVLLLAHVASGAVEAPEPGLLLHKILCGWTPFEPIARSLEPTERERQETIELLESVLEHWQALKKTSVEGLRQSFLRREGRLYRLDAEAGWKLEVGRAGYDVLLDQLPWGMRFVLLPWMREPLTVEW